MNTLNNVGKLVNNLESICLSICLLTTGMTVVCGAQAEPLNIGEKVEFETHRIDGTKEKLFGYLLLPANAQGKVPAMVIVHGSGGVHQVREGRYLEEFASIGLAGFVIDSFTPRGVKDTVADQSKVPTSQMIRDALAALQFLATHARIDAARIGVIGFSKGGSVSLLSDDQRAYKSGPQFAVHIPVYPGCSTQYRHPKPTAPILMLLGEKDNYTGTAPCSEYAERILQAGGDVTVIIYSDAHHGFDGADNIKGNIWLAHAQNYMDCHIYIEDDGRLVDVKTGKVLDSTRKYFEVVQKTCMRQGATVATNLKAKRQSMKDIKSFLTKKLLN
jgi:dienelactone hydrolase